MPSTTVNLPPPATMELWFLLLSILCICASFNALLNLFHHKKLPPGPPTIPFLGNFLWLVKSSKNFSSMEPILRELHAKYGPIVTIKIGSRPAIFITTHEAAHRALVQSGSVFASRPPALKTSQIIFSNLHTVSTAPYGALWRLLRQNFMSVIHPSRLHSFSQGRRWALGILKNNLLAEAELGKAFSVLNHFQHAMFCLIAYMCFGEKCEESVIRDVEAVQRASLTNFIRFNVLNFMPNLAKIVFRKLWNELLEIRRNQESVLLPLIQARREKKHYNSDDKECILSYVDSLLDLKLPDSERKFSDEEIVSLCSEFLNGGTDTSITALQWVMANLVKHQDIQEKLAEEINTIVEGGHEITEEDLKRMPYLKAVVLESIRRHPPGHFILPRAVVEDTKLDGYDIPRDAMVNFTVADLSWDPNVWEDPMEFKPERFLRDGEVVEFDIKGIREIKMMPFGAGRRVCPAITMAMLHQEYYVANLIRDFKWTAENGCDVDLSEKQDFTVVMKNPLHVHISPRTC